MAVVKTIPNKTKLLTVVNAAAKLTDAEKDTIKNSTVIGSFEGECADAMITNLNGMDLGPQLWHNVLESDEYKQAVKLGWYIGFLGHPEDPNCMDFKHACIVLRECRIDDDGKVYGKFDLIDTEVGRIVKAFIDAGVVFGISVRGAGDLENGVVDPDTFVFRGFDLVTFPAFPESIPTFSAVAASTDVNTRQKYKAICAAVNKGIDCLNTIESIDIIQSQFAPNSDEYKLLETRKHEIENDDGLLDDESLDDSFSENDILAQKLDGVMRLYLEAAETIAQLRAEISEMTRLSGLEKIASAKKLAAMKRISGQQLDDARKSINDLECRNIKLNKTINASRRQNLIYKQKITAQSEEIAQKDGIISNLETKERETVIATQNLKNRASNLDDKNEHLEEKLASKDAMIASYQQAYAKIYCSAYGDGSLSDEDIQKLSSSVSVEELENIIKGSTNTSNIGVGQMVQPITVDYLNNFDDNDSEEIVSL